MPLVNVIAHDAGPGTIACEHIGCTTRLPVAYMHSISVSVQYWRQGQGSAGIQCGSVQHFGCCRAHAMEAAHACIDDHHTRSFAALDGRPYPAFLSEATCCIEGCGGGLSREAWHYIPTYAMRGHRDVERLTEEEQETAAPLVSLCYRDVLGGEYWACSADHGRLAAHQIIESVLSQLEYHDYQEA